MNVSRNPIEATASSPGERKTKRRAGRLAIILIAGVGLMFFFLYLCIVFWAALGSS